MEGGFVEDGDAEFLGFGEFASGGFSGEEVMGVFAYAVGDGGAEGAEFFFDGVAGVAGEGSGDDDGFAGEGG